jgi:hypothetical protein
VTSGSSRVYRFCPGRNIQKSFRTFSITDSDLFLFFIFFFCSFLLGDIYNFNSLLTCKSIFEIKVLILWGEWRTFFPPVWCNTYGIFRHPLKGEKKVLSVFGSDLVIIPWNSYAVDVAALLSFSYTTALVWKPLVGNSAVSNRYSYISGTSKYIYVDYTATPVIHLCVSL